MTINFSRGKLIDWSQQFALLIAVTLLFYFFGSNAAENLDKLGIASGFDFLSERAGYDISFSLLEYTSNDSYFKAYQVGVVNTLLVSAMSIVSATVLGFILGVSRVSTNSLVNKLSYFVVEFIRNVPLVIQIIWWYALILSLPTLRHSLTPIDGLLLSNRGLAIPFIDLGSWSQPFWLSIVAAIIIAFIYVNKLKAKAKWKGFTVSTWKPFIAIAAGIPCTIFLFALCTSNSIEISIPMVKGFNYRGGMVIIPELVALWVALSIYSASYIAEIVRGCIQSIGTGQTEAGKALGFTTSRIMWKIVVPQALYPMVPQLTSTYLNLIKNSSLGVVIGFMELVSSTGGTTLNNTGQAIECILLVMATYCSFSLIISAFMNWYNSRVAKMR